MPRGPRLVLAIRAGAACLVLSILWRALALARGPLAGANSRLVLVELGLLAAILILAVLFFERVLVRLVRTRGGKRFP
jgi:hypothetical protein